MTLTNALLLRTHTPYAQIMTRLSPLNSSHFPSGISCSHHITNAFTCRSPKVSLSLVRPPFLRLFRNTVVGVEAVSELLAVLVRGVFGEHLTVCGALEGLEAGLALDGLGGGVLLCISMRIGVDKEFDMLRSISWESYGFQLRLGLLGTSIALAVALLLCSTVLSV